MFGGAASSSATLLGVPRTDGPPLPVFSDPGCRAAAAGCAGQRTVRSSSSDATSALQPPDSNPQSPSADNSSAQPRRTSDPLCGGGAAAAVAATSASAQDAGAAEHVEIVISYDPHDNIAASLSSMNSIGSAGSSAKLAPASAAGCGLAPPPILSPNFWSSATSLCQFPLPTSPNLASSSSSVSSVLPQSISACSLNPPPAAAAAAALLSPSLMLSNNASLFASNGVAYRQILNRENRKTVI